MKYSHLLGTDWAEMNCGQVAAWALKALGRPLAASYVPVDQETAARVIFGGEDVWRRVSMRNDDAEVGDLVVSNGEEGEWHVSAVIKPGWALSSARRSGVFATPVTRIQHAWGVYRFTGVPA